MNDLQENSENKRILDSKSINVRRNKNKVTSS